VSDLEIDVFHFDTEKQSFEDFGQPNGTIYWFGRDLMRFLGYENYTAFKGAINKAISTCATLGIPILDNFIEVHREIEEKSVPDYKLTRFACYLTAMNGDVRKPQIARAQAYFVAMADAFRQYIRDAENIERIQIREDVSEHEVALSGLAYRSGVNCYPLFQNAGYRGLYNMDLKVLKGRKGIELNRSLLDFMGKEELAANLFRITQTEARIRNENVRGQAALENTAEAVGRRVRATILETGGNPPEQLPIAEDIKLVRGGLKKTSREFVRLDKIRKKALPLLSDSD